MFIFTSCTNNYIPKARILASTVKSFHPDWTFCLLLGEAPPDGFVLEDEPFDRVVQFNELGIPDYYCWLFRHRVVEICTAAKGPALDYFLESEGHEKVMYLDPDIMVCNTLEPLEKMLDEHDVLLTPHQLAPQPTEQAVLDNEHCALRFGVFNLGFVAAARRGQGLEFARWWKERLLRYCYDDIPNGLFTDQRWCDLAPAFFSKLHIVRDPGCNAASWNLTDRTITRDAQGTFMANDTVLRFYHFTGFDSGSGEYMTNIYGKTMPAVGELWAIYKERLMGFDHARLGKQRWVYMTFDDGTPITDEMRLVFRSREDLQQAFPNPFDASGYLHWFRTEYPRTLQAAAVPPTLLRRCLRKGKALKDIAELQLARNGGFPQAIPCVAKKVVSKIRQYGLGAVCRAVWRGVPVASLPGAGMAPVGPVPDLKDVLNSTLKIAPLKRLLAPEHHPVCILEHDFGGGAHDYAERRIAGLLKEGRAVLRVRYVISAKQIELTACFGKETFRASVDSLKELADPRFPRMELLVVNELAGWYYGDELANKKMLGRVKEAIAALPLIKQAHNARLEFLFHDFFALCPSINLVKNSSQQFCGLPPVAECADGSLCMGQGCICQTFSLQDWRTAWTALFAQTDSIVFFSENTLRLAEKIYTFRPDQIVLRPHEELPYRLTLDVPCDGPMKIGVVGYIQAPKGAAVVVELGRLLEKEGRGDSIVVFGTLAADDVPETIQVLGPYQREALPGLLGQHGITVGFMSSVWPETFSYVSHELASLGLPLVAFNLGAQGDFVSRLPHGRVASAITAEAALEALRELDAVRRAGAC